MGTSDNACDTCLRRGQRLTMGNCSEWRKYARRQQIILRCAHYLGPDESRHVGPLPYYKTIEGHRLGRLGE